MKNLNLPENGGEKDVSSVEDKKISSMLGNLRRVDAPKNFDFALKAKIAEAQTKTSPMSALVPFLRYAVPFCLLILFAGFVAFNLFLSTDASDIPQIAEINSAPPKIKSSPENNLTAPPYLSETTASNAKKEEVAAASNSIRKATLSNSATISAGKPGSAPLVKDEENEFRGTRESALRESKTIFPRGINPNQPVSTPDNLINQNPLHISDVLRQIGIETSSDWQVKSVKQNSPAERSGVKAGDFIEAIDDRKLTTDTVYTKSSAGKTLHLLRDGKKISTELGKP